MTAFTIANLGDAALNIATETLNGAGTVSSNGVASVKNTSGAAIQVVVTRGLTFVCIVDAAGNAGTYNITIVASDGSTINGAASVVISAAYGHVWLSDNGTNFSVVG